MAGKRVALKHPVERAVDLVFGNFPGHECAIGKIGREQRLPDSANRPRAQHRSDPRHDKIDIHLRPTRDLLKRLAHEALNLVLGNGQDLRIDRIVMLDWQHPN